ncbi:MAG: alpha/beta hydrolase-fold protein [Clostridium sp.]|nr:alpha/beta hydrolase-fold protein [Clostridium sp.]
MNHKITIENKPIFIYGNPNADLWIIQPVDENYLKQIDLELQEITRLSGNSDFFFIAIIISNWNDELSPWSAPPVFGKDKFGNGAENTLSFITDSLIPALKESCDNANEKYYILAGYSLAGLFALWSGFQTTLFSGIAAVSPSVWFPGFVEFSEKEAVKAENVYLSLGDKESHTKNPVMRTVAERLNEEYRILMAQNVNCILEWNPGNHFKDVELRTARGIAWVVNCYRKRV